MRKLLDGLYSASAWLAGISMIIVLIMVIATILSRFFGFAIHGTDSYAGYAMAGAGFFALASTLKHGEHIRVTLFLGFLTGKAQKIMEVAALLIATALSGFLAYYSAGLVWQSWEINDISMGLDATPLWIPQLVMAIGTLMFFIAFCDELVLELLGRRGNDEPQDAHHE